MRPAGAGTVPATGRPTCSPRASWARTGPPAGLVGHFPVPGRPGEPGRCAHSGCRGHSRNTSGRLCYRESVWIFAVVQFGEAGEAGRADLVFGGGGDDAVGEGADGGGASPVLDQGAFA